MNPIALQKLLTSTNKDTSPFVKLSRLVDPGKLNLLSQLKQPVPLTNLCKVEVLEGTCDLCGTEGTLHLKVFEDNVASLLLVSPTSINPERFCSSCSSKLDRMTELSAAKSSLEMELDSGISGLKTVLRIRREQRGKDCCYKMCNEYNQTSCILNTNSIQGASDSNCNDLRAVSTVTDINHENPVVKVKIKHEQPDCIVSYMEIGEVEVIKQETEKGTLKNIGDDGTCHSPTFPENNYFENSEDRNLKAHTCQICERPFRDTYKLRTHLKTHERENTQAVHQCCFCLKEFKYLWKLKEHIEIHKHKASPGMCGICGKKTASFKYLRKHHIIRHGTLEQKDALKKPQQSKRKPQRTFVCSFCQRPFTQKEKLNRHMATHTNDMTQKTHECEFCRKQFQYFWTWKLHIESHANKSNPGKCWLCEKSFTSLKALRTHHVVVHGSHKTCETCCKSFSSLKTLKQHHISIHGSEDERNALRSKRKRLIEKRFEGKSLPTCYFCLRTFYNRGKLRDHIYKHTKEYPYNCCVCKKSAATITMLSLHYSAKHGNKEEHEKLKLQRKNQKLKVKAFQCYFCFKRFTNFFVLKNHVRCLHTKEIFLKKCDKCLKNFTSERVLRHHQDFVCSPNEESRQKYIQQRKRAHEKSKPVCYFCKSVSSRSTALELHLRTHLKERPYNCVKCGKSFNQKGGFFYHSLRVCKTVTNKQMDEKLTRRNRIEYEQRKNKSKGLCENCGRNVRCVKSHIQTCTVPIENRRICKECGVPFHTVQALLLHAKILHGRGTALKCYFCKKQFIAISPLERHINCHTMEKLKKKVV